MDLVAAEANPLGDEEISDLDFDEGELREWQRSQRAVQNYLAAQEFIDANEQPSMAQNTSAIVEQQLRKKARLNERLNAATEARDNAKRSYDEAIGRLVDSLDLQFPESRGIFPWWLYPQYDRPRRSFYAFRPKMAYYRRRGYRRYRRRSYGRKRSGSRLPFGVGAYARGMAKGLRSRNRRKPRKLTLYL